MNSTGKMKNLAAALVAFAVAFSAAHAVDFNMLSCCPGENTTTEARFVWHSSSDACTLRYAKASASGSAATAPCAKTYKPVTFRNGDVNYYKYTAELSSLEPGTEYIYWVEAGGSQSGVQRFKTAGTSGSWNFLWMSDVHSHPDNPGKMDTVELLRQDAESRTASSGGIDFVLFSGDAVKYGSRYDNWQQWNGSPAVTNYMFAMVPGNKEYYYNGSSTFYDYYWYLAVKNNPPNGPGTTEQEGCYWFLRDSVLFVGIDSLVHKGSRMAMYGKKSEVLAAQTNWFDRVVTSQQGKFRYLVVVQHDPWFVYAASKDSFDKSRGNYDVWRHVFDKHKVDLALSGDEHNYIRTKPLRGDAANADGTIYMVAGQIEESNYSATITTSISSYGNASATKYFDCMGATDASCGAAWIEVRPDSLKVTEFWDKYQSPNYRQYDTVTIAPKDRGFVYDPSAGDPETPDAATEQRRFRFAVDAPRSDDWCMQLSEVELLDANGDAIPPSAFTIAYDSTTIPVNDTEPFPADESPENAADGVHTGGGKWLDWRAGLTESSAVRSAVWLDFCFAAPVEVSGYRWYTAHDNSAYPGRTPVSWTFSVSDDGGATWSVLDKVAYHDTTRDNNALAYSKLFDAAEPELPPATGGGSFYGLLVGVNKYADTPDGSNDLKGCVDDAKDVLSAMTNSLHGMWSPQNCYSFYDYDATRSAVRSRFQALAAVAQSGDTVLYYQSSHGWGDETKSAALCMTDKWYWDYDFASDLLRFKTGVRVVVVLDACHSGGMYKGAGGESAEPSAWDFAASVEARMAEMAEEMRTKGEKAADPPSVGWITASDYDQTSLEVRNRGWFTVPFVKAWKADGTDANGDGCNDFVEMFAVAAPQATDGGRQPQKMNDAVLAGVAAWQIEDRHPDSDMWIEETAEMSRATGRWADNVAYGADGKAQLFNNTFTPYNTSTGNVVNVELRISFNEVARQADPDEGSQAGIRLSTNGFFQVWTKETADGAPKWLDVAAEGIAPQSGEEYTMCVKINYTTGRYTVSAGGSRFRADGTDAFLLAAQTNCLSSVVFVGDTLFTSLFGDDIVAVGFQPEEEVFLKDNAKEILSTAMAEWLNKCADGDKAEAQSAAARLTRDEFDTAYLLNLDIAGASSYSFDVTKVDVFDDCVAVEVTLTRSGNVDQKINGVLKFYGASTISAFKNDAAAPVAVEDLSNENFAGGDTATATFQKADGAFFNAKIEKAATDTP